MEDVMRITPLGSGQEVGRSCHLLQFRETTILLDCGIHPGKWIDNVCVCVIVCVRVLVCVSFLIIEAIFDIVWRHVDIILKLVWFELNVILNNYWIECDWIELNWIPSLYLYPSNTHIITIIITIYHSITTRIRRIKRIAILRPPRTWISGRTVDNSFPFGPCRITSILHGEDGIQRTHLHDSPDEGCREIVARWLFEIDGHEEDVIT